MSRLQNCLKDRTYSPISLELARVECTDEKGNGYVTFKPVDRSAVIKGNGVSSLWSLSSMLKAGIDPASSISTGYNTRLEGISDLNDVSSSVDNFFASSDDLPND